MSLTESDASDETLMLGYQRGDRGAFGTLVERYELLVYNFALRSLRSVALAESVTCETFLTAVRTSTSFNHETRFAPWLFRIARTLCREEIALRSLPEYSDLEPQAANDGGGRARASDGDDEPDVASTRRPRPAAAADSKQLVSEELEDEEPVRVVDSQRYHHRSRAPGSMAVQRAVLGAIDRLGTDDIEVLLLKEVAGLPFAEIASIVGSDEDTVKARLRHALGHLQAAIAELDEYALALR